MIDEPDLFWRGIYSDPTAASIGFRRTIDEVLDAGLTLRAAELECCVNQYGTQERWLAFIRWFPRHEKQNEKRPDAD